VSGARLTLPPRTSVASPRLAESPATFECRRYVELDIGYSWQIVLGEGLGLHLRADALNRDDLHADPAVIDAVGRMGGHGYALTRDRFGLPTMTVAGCGLQQQGEYNDGE
jgi:flavin reductase (DIM6/NTAB) family NADH-FMN oxidoreductase RutF